MRDFFAQQEHARHRTLVLALLYCLGVLGVILTIYACVSIGVWLYAGRPAIMRDSKRMVQILTESVPPVDAGAPRSAWRLDVLWYVALTTLLIIASGSLVRIRQLAQGGSTVALLLGGRLVRSDTSDPHERRLMNVVEEMAIASGVAVPHVFLLEKERGINAFAAGFTSDDAAIVVTRGCLQLLTRDELQGVVAHEFSHVLNGDMRHNIRLIGWTHGILCLALLGRMLIETSSRGRIGSSAIVVILGGLILMAIGYTGVLFSRLIKAAFSRQREYLADAAAVQFTRNPAGLVGALKKIGGYTLGSRLRATETESVSHLLFADGLRGLGLFSSHPPLAERIRRLDPTFDGKFARIEAEVAAGDPDLEERLAVAQLASPVAASASRVSPAEVVARVGRPGADTLRASAQLLSQMPKALRDAAHEPLGAMALVIGLLLSDDAERRHAQVEELQGKIEPSVHRALRSLLPELARLDGRQRLPLLDLAIPALRHIAVAQYRSLLKVVRDLIHDDSKVSLFEFALTQIVERRLAPAFGRAASRPVRYLAMTPLLPDAEVLLSALVWVGATEPRDAEAIFHSAMNHLPISVERHPTFVPREGCRLAAVRQSLDRLAHASPTLRARVLEAAAQVVVADRVVSLREAELLRAIAESLNCPLPPFLGGAGPVAA